MSMNGCLGCPGILTPKCFTDDMKRKALIIGNTRGETGVSEDVKHYRDFLRGESGGAWEMDEIDVQLDLTKAKFQQLIATCKEAHYDFFVFIFAGHGGFSRLNNDTVLELSVQAGVAQDVHEREFQNIAPKQLNILDCCRSYYNEGLLKEATLTNRTVRANFSQNPIREHARAVYNALVDRSCPGTITLYACSKGQSAKGEAGKGGAFSNALLNFSSFAQSSPLYTMEEAFQSARDEVVRNSFGQQVPTALLLRCLVDQRLPWAVHAQLFTFKKN